MKKNQMISGKEPYEAPLAEAVELHSTTALMDASATIEPILEEDGDWD